MLWIPLSISLSSKKNAFSNKAFNTTEINTDKVLLAKNSYGIYENQSTLTEEILIQVLETMILE
jgi:electron transfer flavoprotein alpha subunit